MGAAGRVTATIAIILILLGIALPAGYGRWMIRIENAGLGSPPQLYLNSRPIADEQMGLLLTAELKSRSDRVVYVQASGEVEWGDAIGIMDIIRGTGAKVVLLTQEATAHHP
jgi:biopolymer transport protein ExbD